MKKVKTTSIDTHQPSGPLPIPKEVEKLLENWFSLSGFDRRQMISKWHKLEKASNFK